MLAAVAAIVVSADTGCASTRAIRESSRVFGSPIVDVPVMVWPSQTMRQLSSEVERLHGSSKLFCLSAVMHRNTPTGNFYFRNLPPGVTFWHVEAAIETNSLEYCLSGFQGAARLEKMSRDEAEVLLDSYEPLLDANESIGFLAVVYGNENRVEKNTNPLCQMNELQRWQQGERSRFIDCAPIWYRVVQVSVRLKQRAVEGKLAYNYAPTWVVR